MTNRNHRERVARMEARTAEEARRALSPIVVIAQMASDVLGISDAVKRQRKIMRRWLRRWGLR